MDKKIYQELYHWKKKGVTLLLEGRICGPGRIVKALEVAEDGDYMRDYIADESGQHLEAICFNRIVRRRTPAPAGSQDRFRERKIPGRHEDAGFRQGTEESGKSGKADNQEAGCQDQKSRWR